MSVIDEQSIDRVGETVVEKLHRCVTSSGGFTVDLKTAQALSEGVSVCADPSLGLTFPLEEWDDEQVATWMSAQDDRLAVERLHLGGWLDRSTGRVWLDVVRVFPEHLRDIAVAYAVGHRQEAVFDLRLGEVIALAASLRASA